MSSDPRLVGKIVELVYTYPTAVYRCRCDPDPTVFSLVIVTGVGNASACGKCGRHYIIQSAGDIKTGTMMPPKEPGQLM